MNINEAADALGISTKTIINYEKKGFLNTYIPHTLYRDYSRKDFELLQKITLFRLLGLSFDEISGLKQGILDFNQYLQQHIDKLLADESDISSAAIICQNIRREHTDFNSFNVSSHLEHVHTLVQHGATFYRENDEAAYNSAVAETAPHPWRRYFARSLDLSICLLVITAILELLFHVNTLSTQESSLIVIYIVYALMTVTEPLLLSLIGTTPGKWLMGIRVTGRDGNKLSISRSFKRSLLLLRYGFGFMIPFYNLFRLYSSYKTCSQNNIMPWDEDSSVNARPLPPARILMYISAFMFIVWLNSLIGSAASMPINKGAVTENEFYENCNHLIRYNNIDMGEMFTSDTSPYTLTLHDGIVTGLSYQTAYNDTIIPYNNYYEMYIAIMAFLVPRTDSTSGDIMTSGILEQIKDGNHDFIIDYKGYEVKNYIDEPSKTRIFTIKSVEERIP